MQRIDFAGAAPAIAEVAGGRAQVMFPSLFSALPYLRSGRLRALAVAGPARLSELPEVPALGEVGVEGVEVTQWYAMFAPAATPANVIVSLNAGLNDVLAQPETVARLKADGTRVQASSPGELRKLLLSERDRWRAVVQRAGLQPEATLES